MIAIRVDANEIIASGHLMRCLSIADALFSLGEEIIFYTSDEFAEQTITKRGFKAIRLHYAWNDKESELDQLSKELEKTCPRLLLIDSYQVTKQYLKSLRQSVKLAYIDDLNAFDYPVDIVINYSIYAEDLDYPQNKVYLLGIQYADNQFGNVKGFDNRGLMDYAGDVRNTNEIGTEVTKRLLTYHDNNDIILDKVTRMRNLNCRIGAKRLAESLSLDK